MARKNRPQLFLCTCSICLDMCLQGVRQALEDEDTYQRTTARCHSTGPGHWARPHTWWHWSRAACSLDCIQTAPPCRCQSRSLSAFQSGALGLSYTEWHLSWGQLGIRKKEMRQKCRVVVGALGGKTTGKRRDGKTKEAERDGKAFVNLPACH